MNDSTANGMHQHGDRVEYRPGDPARVFNHSAMTGARGTILDASKGDTESSTWRYRVQWDGGATWTGVDESSLAAVLQLCDGCYQAATGLLAECADGCPQDLDHTGLCLRASTSQCQWCGGEDRLREVLRADVEHLLPTAGEEDEGLWWLHWPRERQGPYPSAQAAWTDWHASAEP